MSEATVSVFHLTIRAVTTSSGHGEKTLPCTGRNRPCRGDRNHNHLREEVLHLRGDAQNIVPTQSILESIFYKNSPLHDGAVVIENGRIVATRVILPVSRDKNLPEEYGTRHRGAIGFAEKSVAVSVVVSEERGKVSLVKGTTITVMNSAEELEKRLNEELEI